jgi:hypothetical protein
MALCARAPPPAARAAHWQGRQAPRNRQSSAIAPGLPEAHSLLASAQARSTRRRAIPSPVAPRLSGVIMMGTGGKRGASPDRGFVKSRAHDHLAPGAEPRRTSPNLAEPRRGSDMVRLPSKLRGRFETTKGPVVRCGALVLGRPGDDIAAAILTYSAGRRLESENTRVKTRPGTGVLSSLPGKD